MGYGYAKAIITQQNDGLYTVRYYKENDDLYEHYHLETRDQSRKAAEEAAFHAAIRVFVKDENGICWNLEKAIPLNEPNSNRPSHYHDAPFDVALVQEYVHGNIIKAVFIGTTNAYQQAHWTAMALKHILRAGKKDDVLLELKKARNYLNRAIDGEWLDD